MIPIIPTLITIVVFLAVMVVIVIAHEIGHFVTAKARGVTIIEAGLGLPPRIYGFKRGGIIYSINAIPLGAFVKMAGEEDPGVPGSLASKGAWSRLLVLSSGSVINLLLPIVFFSLAVMIPHNTVSEPVIISAVVAGSPAEIAGFKVNDNVLSVDGRMLDNVTDLHRYVRQKLGNEIAVSVRDSDGITRNLKVVPRWNPPAGQGAIGIQLNLESALAQRTIIKKAEPFWRAIPAGFRQCIDAFLLFKNEIFSWFTGTGTPQVVGPVGMVEMTGEVARSGFSNLLQWAAFISINLGIINLLPLPALDGGRIAFVFLELVRRGRRISPRTEGLIHLAGFVLLIGLMLLITYRDIFNILTSGSAIP